MLHVIVGNLTVTAEHKSKRPDMTVAPPSPYATQVPMTMHPSKTSLIPEVPKWQYLAENRLKLSRDPVWNEKVWEPGPMELSHYMTLTDKDEQLQPAMLPIFADIFLTFVSKNPKLPSWTLCVYPPLTTYLCSFTCVTVAQLDTDDCLRHGVQVPAAQARQPAPLAAHSDDVP